MKKQVLQILMLVMSNLIILTYCKYNIKSAEFPHFYLSVT